MKTTPLDFKRNWINNVRVDFNAGSPLTIRVDFSLGPFYAIGDKIRLIDLDPTAGYVIGVVNDIKKTEAGVFAYVSWRTEDFVRWDPQEF